MVTKFSRGKLDAFRCIELLKACRWLTAIWLAVLLVPSTRCSAQNATEEAAPAVAASTEAASTQVAELPNSTEPTSAGLIDFNRDVRPIFEGSCLDCHGPKDAKEGFRVDEKETLLAYVEPGDLESSSLWSDYLVTTDDDMKMPPAAHNKPLTGAQLATIKLWIEEGAIWADAPVAATAVIAPVIATTKFQRVTKFLGLFHPAAVHFPVALILISTFFVMCSFVFRDAFEGAAFHCLWIGAVSACASSVLGWFFAESQGYGASPSLDLSSALERHRWTAVLLSGLSIAMIPVALAARRKPDNRGRRIVWLLGAGVLSILVSIAGHQGGEMVFGEDLYTPAFKAIFEVPASANN